MSSIPEAGEEHILISVSELDELIDSVKNHDRFREEEWHAVVEEHADTFERWVSDKPRILFNTDPRLAIEVERMPSGSDCIKVVADGQAYIRYFCTAETTKHILPTIKLSAIMPNRYARGGECFHIWIGTGSWCLAQQEVNADGKLVWSRNGNPFTTYYGDDTPECAEFKRLQGHERMLHLHQQSLETAKQLGQELSSGNNVGNYP